ncbi:MAG: hypothetical protein HOI89_05795, partial [Phycisphaerae bacterium]|nr:hypothetical protein [Phycisphaerae bacterium]
MKRIAPFAVVVIAGFGQFVQAQDGPGYGADDPTSKAIERQAHMHDKSTGLLMTFEEAEKAGV